MASSCGVRETDRGSWECLECGQPLDLYQTFEGAPDHLRSLADARGEALDVVVRYRDGWQRRHTSRDSVALTRQAAMPAEPEPH